MDKRGWKKKNIYCLMVIAGALAVFGLIIFAGRIRHEQLNPAAEDRGVSGNDAIMETIHNDNAAQGAEENADHSENVEVIAEENENIVSEDDIISEKADEVTVPEDDTIAEKADENIVAGNGTVAQKAEKLLAGMTLEEKIYQMFIVTPEQLTGVSAVTAAGNTTKAKLEQYPVGGLIYFSANLVSEEQTKTMLSEVQRFSDEIEGVNLFLCIDEEGGRVARIAKNKAFNVEIVPPMANVSSEEEAYHCGYTIGAYLSRLGFNVDFAPDADVLTNSSNSVIGDRSFGSDAGIVTKYAAAYSNGLHSNGIMSTFKHFPGHGATEADTHEGYAYTNKSYAELMAAELQPFSAAGKNGVDMVMAAHISVPAVIGDDTPCSLSEKMITGILRDELQYDGLVITDALNMGAIAEKYDSSSAAVMAVKAGVDILLMPSDFKSAHSGIYTAVQNGEISEERINESVRRILIAKMKFSEHDG